MIIQIIFQSDWWIHILASLVLWLFFYLFEVKYLKINFNQRLVLIQILLANLIDFDHLLSSPIYEPGRCSINNHLLHSYFIFPLYFIGLFSRYRYFFTSLILHLVIDYIGCLL